MIDSTNTVNEKYIEDESVWGIYRLKTFKGHVYRINTVYGLHSDPDSKKPLQTTVMLMRQLKI